MIVHVVGLAGQAHNPGDARPLASGSASTVIYRELHTDFLPSYRSAGLDWAVDRKDLIGGHGLGIVEELARLAEGTLAKNSPQYLTDRAPPTSTRHWYRNARD